MSKKVIIIRGPQGSGKSTMVRRAGLEGHSLSLDKIRDVIAGDFLSHTGQVIPNHQHGGHVLKIFNDSIDRRIEGGEVVCMDGTFPNGNELYQMWSKFDQAGYDSLLIDLWDFDDDLRRERNAARQERDHVPEEAVARMLETVRRTPLPPVMREAEGLRMVRARSDAEVDTALAAIPGFLQDPRCVRDLSAYREVVHIGDIQGCHSPLVAEGSPLRGGLDPEVFYVFLGDLFDRGKENGKVADWFIRNALGRSNVSLIAGNHEDYLDKQVISGRDDIGLPHSEWQRLSWPQLQEAGIGWRDCRRIMRFSQDYLAYTWKDREVLCTHAGFARWPTNLSLVSQDQMRRGSGHYTIDVDAAWSEAEAGTGRFQIHGHRNDGMRPTLATPLSFNLEGQVEFGGHMRFVRLDAQGFSNIDIRPTVFRTMAEDVALNKEVGRMSMSKFPPMLPWAGAAPGRLSAETVRAFSDHAMAQIKDMGNLSGIRSVNFTRDAFHKAQWDRFTTLARGLFIDGEDNSVVARSYPKFFNNEEREETRLEVLADKLSYPVYSFEKLNGFLCITGFSQRLNRPIIASKSRTDGTFAEIAADVLSTTLGPGAMERIMRLNRDQSCSLVFEIEDPERDPHIIKLDRPRAVLLGCIRRSEAFEQASYKDLVKIAEWVGCEVKAEVAVLPNKHALAAHIRRVESNPDWGVNGNRCEGVVLQDSNGYSLKVKSHYYRNWKFMRSAVDEIRRARVADREPRMDRFAGVDGEFAAFRDWALTLSTKALETDIITLRDAFQGDRAPIEALRDEAPETAKPKQSEVRFLALVEQMDRNDRISPDGLARFISSALADPEKEGLLRGYPNFDAMQERAMATDVADGPGF